MELLVTLHDSETGMSPTQHQFLLAGGPLDDSTEADQVFTALGHLAGLCGRLEQHIDLLLMQINKAQYSPQGLDLHDPEHPWQFSDKLNLLKDYFNKHPALAEHAKEIREIATEAKEASLKRNGLIHAIFERYDSKEQIAIFRSVKSKRKSNDFTIIEQTVPFEQMVALAVQLRRLNDRLAAVSSWIFTTDALQQLRKP